MGKSVFIIAFKELASFFDSLIAYVMIVLFLGFNGFFTWFYGSDIFFVGQASLDVFFGFSFWILFFFIPALTMRLVAEEKKTGTIELLLTKSITDREFVLGKFLSVCIMVFICLFCTISYPLTLSNIGNIDLGAVLGGYVGLFLLSMSYIGIGIFASSISNSQIVAFLISIFIGLFFQLIFEVVGSSSTGLLGEIFYNLSSANHFQSFTKGIFDTRDILFFVFISFLGIYLSEFYIKKSKF